MNRRGFLASAVAAALAPVALLRKPDPFIGYALIDVQPYGPVVSPATYTWWRNRDESQIDVAWDPGLQAEMERLYLQCLNDPAPPNLIVWRDA